MRPELKRELGTKRRGFPAFIRSLRSALLVATLSGVLYPSRLGAQLRVANYNVTNFSGSSYDRVEDFKIAIYDQYQGRSMAPDVLIGQEFVDEAGVTLFRDLLNTAQDSPGDWAAAPFINGPDTDCAFFYRISKVTFLGVTIVSRGSNNPNDPPRNTYRYDFRLKGYQSEGATLSCYCSHMKSGTLEEDQRRRLIEAQRIRNDANNLPPDRQFLIGADLNIRSSSEGAYQELVGSRQNNRGRFFDPILTPGNWHDNEVFRFVHTQDPIGPGGMDDRYDQILLGSGLIDGDGFDYIGDPNTPYSTVTWNDPNHSYRAWGNDGTSFNQSLTIQGNEMVGAVIAQALVNAAAGQGHLPVFLDLRVPPQIGSETVLDFGRAYQGFPSYQTLTVFNSGDVDLWGANGIANLRYSMEASAGFRAPSGSFTDGAGGGGNTHLIEMDTSTLGVKTGTLTLFSNAPDEPERIVVLMGQVFLPGDVDGDGCVGDSDLTAVLIAYGRNGQGLPEDFNGDGHVDDTDLGIVLSRFGQGC